MARNLTGKVAIVTGASSGIGAATVTALLQAGVKVVATARRVDRLEALGREAGGTPETFLALNSDVRNEADAEALVAKALAWGGKLDILINNAGLSRGSSHAAMSADDIRLMLETNVFGLANLTRVAIPALKASQGDILNVASIAARVPSGAVYSASKAAVLMFSESLRKELASSKVRVMTVLPGLVSTEFFEAFDDAKKSALKTMAQAVQALTGEDLAEVILFALTRPAHVALNEITVRPTLQEL